MYGKLFLGREQLLIVDDNLGPWPPEGGSKRSVESKHWKLRCLTYDFDGEAFQRRSVVLYFKEFTGEEPVSSLLPVCPLSALGAAKRTEIENLLLARGQKFMRYCTADDDSRLYSYSGSALVDKQGFRTMSGEDASDVSDTFFLPLLQDVC